ncbi:MAG: flagellar hook-length control protein FliK [Paracoccaceae bacterium]|nr:flagellar hook-length control protein FliK [Paracoccaceae bacterium]
MAGAEDIPSSEAAFEPALSSGESRSREAAGLSRTIAQTADLSRAVSVSRQVSEAAGVSSGGEIEVSLSPEELGRVKMTMTPAESGLTVTIQAERPETLDLLRRHIDILAQDLAEQGFTSLNFAFGGSGGENSPDEGGTPAPQNGQDAATAWAEDGATRPRSPGPTASGGLDLRL